MEASGKQAPLEQRIRNDGSAFAVQKEIEMLKIFSWQPSKDLAGSVVEKASDTLKDSDDFGDLKSDSEDLEWESCGEDDSVPTTSTTFPEMKIILQYEKEDWDKELADKENINNPYDFDDVIQSEDFLDQDPAAPCSVQGQPFYDPSLHHVAPLTLKQVEAVLVDGQFDDAVD
ncbi:coordinator of PRMT5 and differentiation stimulator isoform X1 [Sceloporus undulatus]|uniref:coordinator of PRMT5 and differentiation stimulator isoform X1 n=2 Tax=Sceloporus undulatus TaxID=8520 RepID=UPI001C4ABB5A|nr:coordinator of PRMT5 and differentiation stimulator isoform X1 [Sceloporus undulatus]